jgi:fatty-acyl-CoA synthase
MSYYAYPLLIKQILETPRQQASERKIIYRGEVTLDYPGFIARVGQLGAALRRLGVRHGDVVAVMDWDSHRYLECFFAIPMLGATLMKVNVRLAPEQIAYTLDHAGASTLLIHPDFVPLVTALRPRLPALRNFVFLNEDDGARGELPYAGDYEKLLAAEDAEFDFPEFDEHTRATTFYTTGTTGMPKAVAFSHRDIVLHSMTILATMAMSSVNAGVNRDDVYLPLTPMFHAHAWGWPYVATLLGMTQIYPGRFDLPRIIQLFRTYQPTYSHCVPTILHMLLSAPDAADLDLSHWKVGIGGSALSRGLCGAAMDRGVDVFTGWGMSESCPLLTFAVIKSEMLADVADDDVARRARELDIRTTGGLAAPLVQLRVVDAAMNDLPRDGSSAGELVARAPYLTAGYVGNEEASAALWRGGWMHTGDIGTIDAQGYVHILDRAKDVIKTGGEWVSSIGIEDILSQHPDVGEVAVIGVTDPKWGERPLALVVARAGRQADPASLRDFVARQAERGVISKFAIPDRVVLVEVIEKTSVGKLDKKLLRQKYAPG